MPCSYMTPRTNMQKNMQNMHISHCWHNKFIKYEKNAEYLYLTLGLPSEGRQGASLHIFAEYVKYAEYGIVLPVTMKYIQYDVCPASNSFVQYSVYDYCMWVVSCSSVLLPVVALPVTVWQPLTRVAGQWTHHQVARS
jgi:hypothetical protein